jgi:hypothetical protein
LGVVQPLYMRVLCALQLFSYYVLCCFMHAPAGAVHSCCMLLYLVSLNDILRLWTKIRIRDFTGTKEECAAFINNWNSNGWAPRTNNSNTKVNNSMVSLANRNHFPSLQNPPVWIAPRLVPDVLSDLFSSWSPQKLWSSTLCLSLTYVSNPSQPPKFHYPCNNRWQVNIITWWSDYREGLDL